MMSGNRGGDLRRKEDEAGWEEVDDDIARDKVSHGFLTKTRRNSGVGETTTSTTTTTKYGGNNGTGNNKRHKTSLW